MSSSDSDSNSISIKSQLEDLIIIIILLASAAITGWVIANIEVGGLNLVVLLLIELATIIAAINKTLPLLVTTIRHLHRVAVVALESIDDLQSRVEKRKIRIKLENNAHVIEIPIILQKDEIEEVQKTLQLLNEVLEQAKIKGNPK